MQRATTLESDPIVVVTTAVGRPVVSVIGELDAASAGIVRDTFERLDGSARSAVIDLGGCTFMDSAAIHAIADACASHGAVVACPPGNVRRVLEIVAFDKAGKLFESVDEALGTR